MPATRRTSGFTSTASTSRAARSHRRQRAGAPGGAHAPVFCSGRRCRRMRPRAPPAAAGTRAPAPRFGAPLRGGGISPPAPPAVALLGAAATRRHGAGVDWDCNRHHHCGGACTQAPHDAPVRRGERRPPLPHVRAPDARAKVPRLRGGRVRQVAAPAWAAVGKGAAPAAAGRPRAVAAFPRSGPRARRAGPKGPAASAPGSARLLRAALPAAGWRRAGRRAAHPAQQPWRRAHPAPHGQQGLSRPPLPPHRTEPDVPVQPGGRARPQRGKEVGRHDAARPAARA